MNAGTGLFLLGVYIALAAAYAAPSVTNKGVNGAQTMALFMTALAIILTGFKII